MEIREVIVVEGRDDTDAVKKAVTADTIETHGFGIRKETWMLLDKAYGTRGIILFLDPDFSGEEIRRRLTAKYPLAKQAYLDRESATRGRDIGIENARPQDIVAALKKARARLQAEDAGPVFTMKDLQDAGLIGEAHSAEKRRRVGNILGIGSGNGKCFLGKLNQYKITKKELHEAILSQECKGNKE